MRYRAVLVLTDPSDNLPVEAKAQQVYGESMETLIRWAEKALEGQKGARVEVYEVKETLVWTVHSAGK